MSSKTAISQGILNSEGDGIPAAQSISNYHDQYVACFGTESAVFAHREKFPAGG